MKKTPRKRLTTATTPMKSEPLCPSCGVPWIAHLGVAGTCAELMKLKAVIRRIKKSFLDEGSDALFAAKMVEILEEVEE
jgi:hypothetical protein